MTVSASNRPAATSDGARIEVMQAVNTADRMAALEIRREVFAFEQGVADLRVADQDDNRSVIALAVRHDDRHDGEAVPIATGRLTPPIFRGDQALIAWVATLPRWRGMGIGTQLMCFLLEAADAAGIEQVGLAAQLPAESLYLRLGFRAVGPVYDVRGIPHRRMVRDRPR